MKIEIDYEVLRTGILGTKLAKPLSGTLSGHSAGEPFDKYVYSVLKKIHPNNTFRQYEFLNDLYQKNPKIITIEERLKLFNSPTMMFLLSRGRSAIGNWSLDNTFEEKQDDTADILVTDGDYYEIIDIKTRNVAKKAQAPNIISAYKLAQTCALMLDNKEYSSFSIHYFGIDWILENNMMVCQDAYSVNLFKSNPSNLYINWAAAMQIQFHVDSLDQSYENSKEVWAKDYLKHFTNEAKKRSQYMLDKYVKPFEKYINNHSCI